METDSAAFYAALWENAQPQLRSVLASPRRDHIEATNSGSATAAFCSISLIILAVMPVYIETVRKALMRTVSLETVMADWTMAIIEDFLT